MLAPQFSLTDISFNHESLPSLQHTIGLSSQDHLRLCLLICLSSVSTNGLWVRLDGSNSPVQPGCVDTAIDAARYKRPPLHPLERLLERTMPTCSPFSFLKRRFRRFEASQKEDAEALGPPRGKEGSGMAEIGNGVRKCHTSLRILSTPYTNPCVLLSPTHRISIVSYACAVFSVAFATFISGFG